MKFVVSAIFYAKPEAAASLKRNDKLPSCETLRVNRVGQPREDEFNEPPTLEVEGKLEADSLPEVLAVLGKALHEVADAEGFLDLEVEAIR